MCYIISYTLFYVQSTQFCWEQSLLTHFAIVAKDSHFWLSIVTSLKLICDAKRTQGTGIVTSYSSIVLAH